MQLKRWIALVGLMGAGKTSVGHALSAALRVECIDTDDAIEEAAAMSIPEIFERDGEAFFRQKEGQILARLLGGAPAIMSTGGGAFIAKSNREILLKDAFVIWLDSDLDTLWNRVKGKDDRPLLNTDDPKQTLSDLKSSREPAYAQAHLKVFSGANTTIPKIVDQIMEAAKSAGAVEG